MKKLLVSESLNEYIDKKPSTYRNYLELKKNIKKLFPKAFLSLDFYRNLEPANYLYLHKIEIPKEYKNQGIGSKVMQILCNFCDNNNLIFKLSPTDNFGSEINRLINFYKKFDFNIEENSDEMIRYPKIESNPSYIKGITSATSRTSGVFLKSF
jgi:ribosomal protein S18 acetylase RimI-like enzyme